MAISNGDILRVALRWKDVWDNDYVNVWYMRVVDRGAGTQDQFLEATAKHIAAAFGPYCLEAVSTGYHTEDCTIEKVEFSSGKINVVEAYPAVGLHDYVTGNVSADSLPPNNAPLVTWKTAGVKTFVKKFLMPPTEGKYGDTGFSSSVVAIFADFIAFFLSDIVFSSVTDGTIRAVVHSKRAAAWLTLLSGVVSKYVSHQDRRATGVGS